MCGCGDPTLTIMGTEQPYEGRLRFSAESRYREDRVGEPGVDRYTLRELRTDLSAAWSASRSVVLSATLPILYRMGEDSSLREERAFGLGDVELRLRLVVARDRAFAPEHLLALVAGAGLPTAPVGLEGIDSSPSADVQPGSGALQGIVGAAYSHFAEALSLYASATWMLPVRVRGEVDRGPTMRVTLAGQAQLSQLLAVRVGVDGRADAPSRIQGSDDPNSGGFILFASPDLLFSPTEDLLFAFGVRAPFYQALRGAHVESVSFNASVIWDTET